MGLRLSFAEGAALVTGSGRVGGGIARLLARAGVPVVFTYCKDAARAEATEVEISAAGGRAKAVALDLTDTASIDAAIEAATKLGGRLRHVISAGAPMTPFGVVADIDFGKIEQFLTQDALGNLRLTQRIMPHLRKTGGSFTYCTTIANYRVVAYDGPSPFSKGAVEALMRQVAAEEGRHGVRANAVAVSWVSDQTIEEQRAYVAGWPGNEAKYLDEMIDQLAAGTPITPHSSSEEGAWPFAFLASEQARFITGQVIRIDGGFSLGGV
jgi:NAD(P)-dependent dehydrogenase (short-subunit alcohol dehydrogenase family)